MTNTERKRVKERERERKREKDRERESKKDKERERKRKISQLEGIVTYFTTLMSLCIFYFKVPLHILLL